MNHPISNKVLPSLPLPVSLLASLVLLSASSAQAQTVRTWTGAEDDLLTNVDNFNPAAGWGEGDTLLFDGSDAGDLDLSTGSTNSKVQLDFADTQTGAVNIRLQDGAGGNFRLGSGNNSTAITIAAGAGKVTIDGFDSDSRLSPIFGDTGKVNIYNAGTLEFGEFTRLTGGLSLRDGGHTTILGEMAAGIQVTSSVLTLDGTYTANTDLHIDSGRVDFTSSEAMGVDNSNWSAIRMGNSNNAGGTLRYIGTGDAQIERQIQLGNGIGGAAQTASGTIENESATGKLVFTNTLLTHVVGNTKAARTLTLGGSNTMDNEIQGVIADHNAGAGSVGLVKVGAGKWILSGENTYSDATTVAEGTLAISATGSVASNSIHINSGRLDFVSADSIGGDDSAAEAIRLGNNIETSPGTLTYSGTTDSQFDRRVQIGNGVGGSAQTASAAVENNSATGKLVFGNATFNQAASGTQAARTLTLGGSNAMDNEILGVIADNDTANGGTVGLIKADAGQWILSGANTYTGATTIEQGTLAISATGSIDSSSNVMVAEGATFDVSGVTGGFSLASGQSVGGLGTVTGDLVFESGAHLIFDAAAASLLVTGDVSFDDSFGVESLLGADGSEVVWSTIAAGTYTLLDNDSNFDNISNFGAENAYDLGGGRSAYFQNGSLELVVVVPEPSSYALLGGLLMLGWALTRRRLD